MSPDARKHLFDVAEGRVRIQRFTRGRSFEAYSTDDLLRSAVERQFEVVGEALRRLSHDAPDAFDRITSARRIIGFRNILAHGYDTVSNELVWSFVVGKVPALLTQENAMLSEP
jgi:uncharacterized protein with HEPN domain